MSRNSRRSQLPESAQQIDSTVERADKRGEKIEENKKRDNSQRDHFGLPFVTHTETVFLPSGGSFYDSSSPVCGIDSIEINAMTAKEEDILINDSYIQQGVVFERLIDSLIVTPGIKCSDLLDCDKVAILVSARKTGYGNQVDFETVCDHCGHQHVASVELSSLLERVEHNKFVIKTTDEWRYNKDSSTLGFKLPVTGIEVEIRLLTPEDRIYLTRTKKQKEKLRLPFSETVEFIRLALVSANGVTEREALHSLVEHLPSADARKIKVVHNKNIPKFETKQEFVCPSCSEVSEKEVPFSLGWFWSD
tara:strand:+ start:5942 stop:6859 length:918 start_codon:yes stop_codon:yes gene_type:complete